jgi:hypothetical protein
VMTFFIVCEALGVVKVLPSSGQAPAASQCLRLTVVRGLATKFTPSHEYVKVSGKREEGDVCQMLVELRSNTIGGGLPAASSAPAQISSSRRKLD